MNYATIKNCDIANGPGVRVSVFVSGCTRRCKDCFNREAWDFQYGAPFTQETIDQILAYLKPDYICGITVLGGEPFEPQNQPGVLELLRQVRGKYPKKSVWVFTGYTLDGHILSKKLGPWPVTEELLSYIDVLVDGPFLAEEKDLSLRFRGSRNQRLIDLRQTLASGQIVLWTDWQTERKAPHLRHRLVCRSRFICLPGGTRHHPAGANRFFAHGSGHCGAGGLCWPGFRPQRHGLQTGVGPGQ